MHLYPCLEHSISLFSHVSVTFYLFADIELFSGIVRESGNGSAFISYKFELQFIFLLDFTLLSKC